MATSTTYESSITRRPTMSKFENGTWAKLVLGTLVLTFIWLLLAKVVPQPLYIATGVLLLVYGYGCAINYGETSGE